MLLSESVLLERLQIALEAVVEAAKPIREAGALDHVHVDELRDRLADVLDASEAIKTLTEPQR
jgi:hypothetical protein